MKVMKKNQTYFLKDIIQAVKSEKLDDDFCLYAKENGELNFQDSYLPCRYIWQWLWEFEKPISFSSAIGYIEYVFVDAAYRHQGIAG